MFLIVSHVCAAGFVFFFFFGPSLEEAAGTPLPLLVSPFSSDCVQYAQSWPDFCACTLNSCIFEQFVVQSINCESVRS